MTEQLLIKTSRTIPAATATMVLFAAEGKAPRGVAKDLLESTGRKWKKLAQAADFSGTLGQSFSLLAPTGVRADRLVVFGLGDPDAVTDMPATRTLCQDMGGKLMGVLGRLPGDSATLVLSDTGMPPEAVAHMMAGMHLRHYRFDKYKTGQDEDDGNGADRDRLTLNLVVDDKAATDRLLASAMASVQGTLLARDLVHEPPNVLGPQEFAEKARALEKLGVKVEILDAARLEKLGMGALLAVARGAARPARVAVMQWQGGRRGDDPVAFVGKGVVFDTGGISIKPAGSMQNMKADMAGAAAVTGLMKALALRKARCNAVGVIGLVENMPDGNAYRPGDIIPAMSGTTIEVVNTDCEGRMVLADLLWYTQERFAPRFMVNLATLTGAIMVALGQDYAGLFANDDELARDLVAAGSISGEKLWRMPLGDAYDKLIKSRFADIKNAGGRYGGAITAAQFLQKFVNDTPWAHLDIAGVGFATPSCDTNQSWASGFGVAVLDQLVRDHCENKD